MPSSLLGPKSPTRPDKILFHRQYRSRWFSRLVLLLIIGCASVSAASKDTKIRSIGVDGNKNFSKDEILNLLSLKPRSPFSQEVLNSSIMQLLRRYQEEGFYAAAVESVTTQTGSDSSEVDIVLYVHEGDRTELGDLQVTGNHALSTGEILLLFDSKVGTPLRQAQLENDFDALLKKYEGIGYPFAKVEVDSLSMYEEGEQKKLSLRLNIQEGALTTIEEVKIEGNKDTKDYVIMRELGMKPGDVYSRRKVEAIKHRLGRLNLFSTVSDPELYVGKKGGGLLVKVQEGNTNSFDGIIGYVPKGTANQPGNFTGFVNVSLRNLFGTGRRLGVRWQRENQETQEVELHYLEPWFFNLPVNVGVGFLQREQDSSYVRRKFDLKGDASITDELSLALLFGQDRIIPSSTLSTPFVSESKTTAVGVEIRYDTRDDFFSPTTGILYRSDYRVGRKTFSGSALSLPDRTGESVTVKRLGVDLEFYLQPFFRQVIGTGLHAKDLRSDRIEDGDLYRFGGTNTLRGYRENQFLGSSIVWSNLEYRFLMGKRSFLFGFIDTGYFFRPVDERRAIESSEALKVGYGLGFRVETSLGLLGVSYALGRGDTFSTGKIHFGIINQF